MLGDAQISSQKQRWLMLAVLLLARTAMAYQFASVGAIGPLLIGAYDIDYTWLGTLIGLYLLPGVFVALPSGLVGQRFGSRRVVLLGLGLMAGGGLLSASESIHLAFAGRLIGGVGGVALNVMMTRMVADWFAEREIVVAMSILVASWPFGIALGLVSFPAVASAWSWPAVMYATAAAALLSFALVMLLYRDPSGAQPLSEGRFRIALTGREWLLVVVAGLIWGAYNVAYIVLVSFLPDLLTERGYSLGEAGRIASTLGWSLIFVVPLAGLLAQRSGRSDLFLTTGLVMAALAGALLPVSSLFAAAFTVVAIFSGVPAGAIMALPTEALAQENRAVGMGIYFTCYYACMATLPALAGRMRDVSGSSASPALFAAAMMAVALLGLLLFRIIQRGGKTSARSSG